MKSNPMYLSLIIPMYNEEENVPRLYSAISQILREQAFTFEIIFVDDGSTDGTAIRLRCLAKEDPSVRVVQLRRNFGQTAAISAGVALSQGEIMVFMDGDLQNDPIDIPRLLAKLDEGYDIVSGWRKNRKDAQLSRKLPSLIANRIIAKVTGVKIHDYGCTSKAYRRGVFQYLRLYGEMHRYMPAYAALSGAKIAEIEVIHHPRRFGKSKYGISRTLRVILDLITLKFLGSFGTKPLHAFGGIGLFTMIIGGLLSIITLGSKVFPPHTRVHRNPLLPISLHFSGFGMQCIMLGLLSELLMRTYHESQGKSTYVVKEVISLHHRDTDDDGIPTTRHLDPAVL